MPKPAAISASSRTSAGPSPAVSERCCGGGSVSTRSTVAEPRWKNFRIALRAGGTAIATPIASATTAAANNSRGLTPPGPDASLSRTREVRSGVCGNSSSPPSATSARSSSVIRLPQPLEGTRIARLDRPLRHVERLGDLELRQPEEVAHRHDQALLLRQLVHRREQTLTLLGREQHRLGGRGRVPRGLLGRRAQRQPRPPPRRADA